MMQQVRKIGFTKMMDETLRKAHLTLNYTPTDIYNACATLPMHPSLLKALSHSVISDAVKREIVKETRKDSTHHFHVRSMGQFTHDNLGHSDMKGPRETVFRFVKYRLIWVVQSHLSRNGAVQSHTYTGTTFCPSDPTTISLFTIRTRCNLIPHTLSNGSIKSC